MVNPYQSPVAVDDSILATEEESLAAARVRIAVIQLSLGALANLGCIDLDRAMWDSWIGRAFAVWDVIWLAALCSALWRFGPSVLEWLATQLYRLFGGTTSLDAWLTSYRQSLWPLPIAAAIGLPLWLLWLGCYFGWGMRIGSPLNTLFLVAGNLLGAWVYLTVFAGWVRLRMSETPSGGSLPPAMGPASAAGPE